MNAPARHSANMLLLAVFVAGLGTFAIFAKHNLFFGVLLVLCVVADLWVAGQSSTWRRFVVVLHYLILSAVLFAAFLRVASYAGFPTELGPYFPEVVFYEWSRPGVYLAILGTCVGCITTVACILALLPKYKEHCARSDLFGYLLFLASILAVPIWLAFSSPIRNLSAYDQDDLAGFGLVSLVSHVTPALATHGLVAFVLLFQRSRSARLKV